MRKPKRIPKELLEMLNYIESGISYHLDKNVTSHGLLQWKIKPRMGKGARAREDFKSNIQNVAGYLTIQSAAANKWRWAINVSNFGAFYSHRIIWAMHYGQDELLTGNYDVDHINGDTTDNRISNLRLVTRSQNLQNKGPLHTNKLGVKGVYYHKKTKKYCAHITVSHEIASWLEEGQSALIHLGSFDTLPEAVRERKKAEKKYQPFYGETYKNRMTQKSPN